MVITLRNKLDIKKILHISKKRLFPIMYAFIKIFVTKFLNLHVDLIHF